MTHLLPKTPQPEMGGLQREEKEKMAIYRIELVADKKIQQKDYISYLQEEIKKYPFRAERNGSVKKLKDLMEEKSSRKGGHGLCFGVLDAGLPCVPGPRTKQLNPRARFYFTEEGFKVYGKHMLKVAQKAGEKVYVIKRKEPPKSAVTYRDRWQVAVLPDTREKK